MAEQSQQQPRTRRRWRHRHLAASSCLASAAVLLLSAACGLRCASFLGFVAGGRGLGQELGRPPRSSGTGSISLHALGAPAVAGRRRPGGALELGHRLEGVVKACSKEGAVIDVGLRRPAFVHVTEIQDEFLESAALALHKGQVVDVCVLKDTMKEITASIKRANRLAAFDFHVGQEVEGTVVYVRERKVWVDIGAVADALLHNDFDETFSEGQQVKAQVRQVSSKGIKLTTGGKDLKLLTDFNVGDDVEGTVVKVSNKLAFIDIGAIREASLDSRHVDEEGPLWSILSEGQTVKARILSIDSKGIKLTMTMTGLSAKANSGFQIGEILPGRVLGFRDAGAYVDVGAMMPAFLEDCDGLERGQTVDVEIWEINSDRIVLKPPPDF